MFQIIQPERVQLFDRLFNFSLCNKAIKRRKKQTLHRDVFFKGSGETPTVWTHGSYSSLLSMYRAAPDSSFSHLILIRDFSL